MFENQKIIAFSGRKQSGKGTSCNFLHALALVHMAKVTPLADVHPETGELFVRAVMDEKGTLEDRPIDLNNRDEFFRQWMSEHVWPFMRKFSFANAIKETCIKIFGLSEESVYGSNGHKDQPTHLLWERMPVPPGKKNTKKGPMTAREFMQYFGTQIGRQMDDDVWTKTTLRNIARSMTAIAVIDDLRFPNELEAVQKVGGKVIRLTRVVDPADVHESETALDKDKFDWSKFDAVIDNENLTIDETNEKIFELLVKWGIVVTEEKEVSA